MFGLIGFIIGVLFVLFAVFAIFFVPAAGIHQQSGAPATDYGLNAVIFGFIVGAIGVALVMLP
jgi:hypothetical protein